MFHGLFADLLDIDLSRAPNIQIRGIKPGDSALVTCYGALLQIGILEKYYPTLIYFSYDIAVTDPGLLGQIGFFDQ